MTTNIFQSSTKRTFRFYLITMLFFSLLISVNKVFSQKCSVQISDNIEFFKRSHAEEMDVFMSLEFKINAQTIKATDTTPFSLPISPSGFDTVNYSFIANGVRQYDWFICKFRPKETYIISPCTCCGIFLMTPTKDAERGFVKYINRSDKTFVSESGESQIDTLHSRQETEFIFSSISMNCGFRPNTIFVAELDYLDQRFDYDHWKTKSAAEQDLLQKEQQGFIRFSCNYLFLHGERLVVTVNQTGNAFRLELEK